MAMKKTCPECGARRRGRGYEHRAGCGKASVPGGSSKRRLSAGFSVKQLKGLDVEALLVVRDQVDELIKSKAPELKKRISDLNKIHKAISG